MVNISVKVKSKADAAWKVHPMKIGELAKLSNTPTRSLRYYEEQGLIIPSRLANGYRDYDAYLIDRAMQIRGLIDSGVPTKIIALILPCLDKPRGIVPEEIEPELLAILSDEREKMTQRIDFLTRNRDSINAYIEAAEQALVRRLAPAG